MKIKNLNIWNDKVGLIVGMTLFGAASIGTISYYSYEKVEQVKESDINIDDLIIKKHDIYYLFQPGEHTIKISRNDAYFHKIEQVDGYEIAKVNVNGWRDNNQVIYVNDEPVLVKLTSSKNGNYSFDDFGKVQTEKEIQKIKRK